MVESTRCSLPLAFIPDGALAIVFSFVGIPDLLSANQVCRAWVMEGNRVDLWASLGKSFEVAMPVSLGPQPGASSIDRVGAKRVLRSGANAKRTFLKSVATAINNDRLKHDATLSEAYTLFRMQDSVVRLRTLLRRKWGIFQPSPKRGPNNNNINSSERGPSPTSAAVAMSNCLVEGAPKAKASNNAARASSAGGAWRGSGRWTFNINHRHGIFEGNTLLNFAVRCGRRKCVEFVLRMGADTEIPDYGGFTPVLNTAWRGDAPLLKILLAAGARLDVKGVSRGVGPYSPLEWAERKNRPVTADFLRSLALRDEEGEGDAGAGAAVAALAGGGSGKKKTKAKSPTHSDVRVDAP